MLTKIHLSIQAVLTKLIKTGLKVNNQVNQAVGLATKLSIAKFDKFVPCFGIMQT